MQDLWPEGKDGASCLPDMVGTEESGLVYPGKHQVGKEPSAMVCELEDKKKRLEK